MLALKLRIDKLIADQSLATGSAEQQRDEMVR